MKLKARLFGAGLYIIGAFLIIKYSGYMTMLGIFLLQWSSNVETYIKASYNE